MINPYSFFKFKIFVLNTSLFTFYATLSSWYDYAWLQHSRTCVTGANNCTGANYIILVEALVNNNAAVIALKRVSQFVQTYNVVNLIVCDLNQYMVKMM